MSNSLNKVQLIGNLTADPDIRETPTGQKVAVFSIATNRKWKDTSGALQEEVEYHNCVVWRGLAEIADQYMHKGNKVYAEGYIKTRSWDGPDGSKRYKTEIIVDSIILLGTPGASGVKNEPFPDDDFQKAEKAKKRKTADENISIEDIPF